MSDVWMTGRGVYIVFILLHYAPVETNLKTTITPNGNKKRNYHQTNRMGFMADEPIFHFVRLIFIHSIFGWLRDVGGRHFCS